MSLSTTIPLTVAAQLVYDPTLINVDPVNGVSLAEISSGVYQQGPAPVSNPNVTFEASELDSLTETIASGTGTAITFQIVINGVPYWYSGSQWEISDGTAAQSSASSAWASHGNTFFSDTELSTPAVMSLIMFLSGGGSDAGYVVTNLTATYEYDDPIVDYYANLLIIQYINKPKAYATIQALSRMAVMSELPISVQNAFDIDTAVGAQLDILGKYMNVKRSGGGPNGPIVLDDANFRTLIKIAIIQNNAGSSLATIDNLLFTYFGLDILVFDYANMRMSYLINSALGSLDLVFMFILNGLLPKPMGVQLASIIYSPDVDKFFGLVRYKEYINNPTAAAANRSPLNTYADYNMDFPMLSYKYAITI